MQNQTQTSIDGKSTIASLAAGLGVILTPAGSSFPYGVDPDDSLIRLAPTSLSMGDLRLAIKAFALCVKLASIRRVILLETVQ